MKIYEPTDRTIPFNRIIADITHRCNMSCNNCYLPNRGIEDMDKLKLFEMIDKLPRKFEIHLQGGEATLRKDLPEIISYIKNKGHLPVLLTNGLKLQDIDYVKSLKDAGLKHCYISFNGGTNDEYYKALDGGEYAKQKIEAVKNVLSLDMYLSLGVIISKGINENAIKDVVDFAVANKGKYYTIRFKTVGAIGRYQKGEQYTQKEFIKLLSKQLKEYGVTQEHIYKWQKKDPEGFDLSFSFPVVPLEPKSNIKIRGGIWVKFPYWGEVGNKGIVFDNQDNKGRVTKDFKIAPFFEHIKANEFNY